MEKSKSFAIAGILALGPAAVASGQYVEFFNEKWPNWWGDLEYRWDVLDANGNSTDWSEWDHEEYVMEYFDAWDMSCGCPPGYTPPCYWHADPASGHWEYW